MRLNFWRDRAESSLVGSENQIYSGILFVVQQLRLWYFRLRTPENDTGRR